VAGRKRPFFCTPLEVADASHTGDEVRSSMAAQPLLQLAALLGRMAAREVCARVTQGRCDGPQGIEGNEVP
jgi:hypothetical protein